MDCRLARVASTPGLASSHLAKAHCAAPLALLARRCFHNILSCYWCSRPQKQGALLAGSSGRGRYGGLSASLQKLQRSYQKAQGEFHEDTVYVCGEPRIDSVSHEVHIVLSTDNLLLNAYRQTLSDLPISLLLPSVAREKVTGSSAW